MPFQLTLGRLWTLRDALRPARFTWAGSQGLVSSVIDSISVAF
jgi:hypothetical protein